MLYRINKKFLIISTIISLILELISYYIEYNCILLSILTFFIYFTFIYISLLFIKFYRKTSKFCKSKIAIISNFNENLKQMFIIYKHKILWYFNDYKIVLSLILLTIMSIFIYPIIHLLRLTYYLAAWLSGIGSLSAAIVALKIAKHHEPPKIGHFKLMYYKKGWLIIQIFNYSKTITFIRLDSIVANNGTNSKKEPIPDELIKHAEFNPLRPENVISIKILRNFNIIENFMSQNFYTNLRFNFDYIDGNKSYTGVHSVDITQNDFINKNSTDN